jgi:hypothetical protein
MNGMRRMQKKKFLNKTFVVALLAFCFSLGGLCQETTIKNSIPVPKGYQRKGYPQGSYSNWLQNLTIKNNKSILDYRGQSVESGFYNVFGVAQIPLLFKADLEQCADFAMRFWAEYHKAEGKLNTLFLFDYNGRKVDFGKSGKTFVQFLRSAFANTNSHSIKNGCKTISANELRPGDMFVQNERGGIGHVSIIMDLCHSQEGKELLLVGYSFMPAQEFHVEKAEDQYGIQGWFTREGYERYLADHLNFGRPVLRRFE